ncbi:MAG: hypothetical protein HC927_02995 [Deltaproteobacteria bacterium]|nr:hypothetical protein [Deltaproteobacteria bacterium]
MTELLESKWKDIYPDEELSDWEKEGAGYQHGLAEGAARGSEKLRAALFGILSLRGFTIDEATRERIEGCNDLDQLDRWRARAMQVDRIEWLFTQDA